MIFDSIDMKKNVAYSGQEGSTLRQWDCKEVTGGIEGCGGDRNWPIWCSNHLWRVLAFCISFLADTGPQASHHFEVD